jgi:hypothetical protein
MQRDREKRIEHRAYEIWEREGRPHGQHGEHWRRAEEEIAREDGNGGPAMRAADPEAKMAKAIADHLGEESITAAPKRKAAGAKGASAAGGGGTAAKKTAPRKGKSASTKNAAH